MAGRVRALWRGAAVVVGSLGLGFATALGAAGVLPAASIAPQIIVNVMVLLGPAAALMVAVAECCALQEDGTRQVPAVLLPLVTLQNDLRAVAIGSWLLIAASLVLAAIGYPFVNPFGIQFATGKNIPVALGSVITWAVAIGVQVTIGVLALFVRRRLSLALRHPPTSD